MKRKGCIWSWKKKDGTGRRQQRMLEEQVCDIIANCKRPADDKTFADKYGVSASHVRSIRLGYKYTKLRARYNARKNPDSELSETRKTAD